MTKLDSIDRKILDVLQRDASVQVSELAAEVGLSTTPCWRRVQRLKESGVITRNVMLVDPASGKRTRVGMRVEGDRKVRVSRRKDGGVIDK